jgi:hypothetical protein
MVRGGALLHDSVVRVTISVGHLHLGGVVNDAAPDHPELVPECGLRVLVRALSRIEPTDAELLQALCKGSVVEQLGNAAANLG